MIYKYLGIVLFCLVNTNLLGQEMSDLIITNKHDSIKCEITLINDQNVFYNYKVKKNVKSSFLSKDSVLTFYSDDNQIVKFENDKDNSNPEKVLSILSSDSLKTIKGGFDGNYFLIGIGVGSSYGALGLRAQIRRGGILGYGFHIGIGILPSDFYILGSTGVKVFMYKNFYLNAQIGTYGKNTTIEQGEEEVKRMYGTSFLLGIDWSWDYDEKIGLGLNFGGGIKYILNDPELPLLPSIDLGFLVRF